MTVEELRKKINNLIDKDGIMTSIPSTMEVDMETYVNVCRFIFKSKKVKFGNVNVVRVFLGDNGEIMYKGIELILKEGKKK